MYDLLDAPVEPECVVQGQIVSNSHLEHVLPGEGAVRIKREVLIAVVRRTDRTTAATLTVSSTVLKS